MGHSVRRHLRLAIDEYDATIRRWIPGYETMLQVAAEAAATAGGRVVDLGSGTGALAEVILERHAGAVELLDADPEMLERARIRLARFGARAVFRVGTFDDPFGPSEAVTASLALHHVPTLKAKARVFARAFDALPPGGVFVNADATMPADPTARHRSFRHWADHMVAQGIAEEQAWEHFRDWSGEDTYLSLEDELASLRAVGFEAEQVWADGPIGVVVAVKP